ncbi:hypothetical protein ABZY19_28970 [Streptomyces sp. NPDC006475]|uniref:hypothetical protein n=1 Tax=Streptomyces sp. NPDC006475 TaxID=3155719 RepID=UPI0033A5F926
MQNDVFADRHLAVQASSTVVVTARVVEHLRLSIGGCIWVNLMSQQVEPMSIYPPASPWTSIDVRIDMSTRMCRKVTAHFTLRIYLHFHGHVSPLAYVMFNP